MKTKLELVLILIIVFCGTAPAGSYLPVNQPEYRFIYDLSDRYQIGSGHYSSNYNVGPINLDDQPFEFPLSKFFLDKEQNKINLFLFVGEEFHSEKGIRADGVETIRGGLSSQLSDNVSIYVNFVVDEALANDPEYSGKKWRGLAGGVENGFIAYKSGKIEALFGRFGAFAGPVRNSLVLSSYAEPMDAIQFRYNLGKLSYSYQFAKLNGVIDDSSTVVYNRYFAGHRIDFKLFENLNIGLFETIIFGGENRALELSYLNPLNFYHAEQLNENKDDNIFLGFDFAWYLNSRYKIYGQLLVDDVQIESSNAGDNEPSEIGITAGFETLNLLDLIDMTVDYTRITNRTYNQNRIYNRYENKGVLIGNSLGNDADSLSLSIGKWLGHNYRGQVLLTYIRQGEGSFDDPWTEPWLESDSSYSEPFPSGNQYDKRFGSSLNLTGYISDLIFIDINAGLKFSKTEYRNESISEGWKSSPYLNIYLSAFLNSAFLLD